MQDWYNTNVRRADTARSVLMQLKKILPDPLLDDFYGPAHIEMEMEQYVDSDGGDTVCSECDRADLGWL